LVWTFLTVIAFYLGAMNTLLAEYAGTCTQGDADHMSGIILSTILFLSGCVFLFKARNILLTSVLCAPVFVLILWNIAFAFYFTYAVLILQQTACEVLNGYGFPPSGNEFELAVLWMIFGLSVPIAIIASYTVHYLRSKKPTN
jgi:hypothetical protein